MKPRTVWQVRAWKLAALPVALLAMQAAFAQPPPGPPRGGPPPIERLAQELNLDATQKAEVQRIFEEQRAKHETERKQYAATGQRPTPEEMQTMMQQHEEELRLALSGVLTSEQLTKFTAIQKERRGRMRNGPPPPPPQ
jgi:Spy/CpxP family protein refolding chaperone